MATSEATASADTNRCRFHNVSGRRCVTSGDRVGGDGLCRRHRLTRSGEIDVTELPPLQTYGHAKAWLRFVARNVALRRLTHQEGLAISRAVSDWIKAETAGATAREAEELERRLKDLERQLRSGPQLKAVP